ncbi:hypothetical protein TgHK011_003995 [Trichoderma gracile]|nr:hypothetical protein TgHK011_003995 [Trichoderma gracile]
MRVRRGGTVAAVGDAQQKIVDLSGAEFGERSTTGSRLPRDTAKAAAIGWPEQLGSEIAENAPRKADYGVSRAAEKSIARVQS